MHRASHRPMSDPNPCKLCNIQPSRRDTRTRRVSVYSNLPSFLRAVRCDETKQGERKNDKKNNETKTGAKLHCIPPRASRIHPPSDASWTHASCVQEARHKTDRTFFAFYLSLPFASPSPSGSLALAFWRFAFVRDVGRWAVDGGRWRVDPFRGSRASIPPFAPFAPPRPRSNCPLTIIDH